MAITYPINFAISYDSLKGVNFRRHKEYIRVLDGYINLIFAVPPTDVFRFTERHTERKILTVTRSEIIIHKLERNYITLKDFVYRDETILFNLLKNNGVIVSNNCLVDLDNKTHVLFDGMVLDFKGRVLNPKSDDEIARAMSNNIVLDVFRSFFYNLSYLKRQVHDIERLINLLYAYSKTESKKSKADIDTFLCTVLSDVPSDYQGIKIIGSSWTLKKFKTFMPQFCIAAAERFGMPDPSTLGN